MPRDRECAVCGDPLEPNRGPNARQCYKCRPVATYIDRRDQAAKVRLRFDITRAEMNRFFKAIDVFRGLPGYRETEIGRLIVLALEEAASTHVPHVEVVSGRG